MDLKKVASFIEILCLLFFHDAPKAKRRPARKVCDLQRFPLQGLRGQECLYKHLKARMKNLNLQLPLLHLRLLLLPARLSRHQLLCSPSPPIQSVVRPMRMQQQWSKSCLITAFQLRIPCKLKASFEKDCCCHFFRLAGA